MRRGWKWAVCFLLAGTSVWAQPDGKCVETAELLLLVSQGEPRVAVPGLPVTMLGSRSKLVITQCLKRREKALTKFAWKVEGPDGTAIAVQGANTATITFTPQQVGPHKVTLIGCPAGCREILTVDFTATNKPIKEAVQVGPETKTAVVEVAAEAQLAPVFTPPPSPRPLVSDGAGGLRLAPETQPGLEQYRPARAACSPEELVGTGAVPQWFTTSNFPPSQPLYTLVEGRVYHTLVSRKDHPASHHSNDANSLLEVDPHYQHLLVADTPVDKGFVLPLGGLEIEWEEKELPESFRTMQGDRLSALGFHVIDCGHDTKATEIHPPIAVAVHRPRAVTLPEVVAFEKDTPAKPLGRNVVTPGIVTDIWVSLRGGQVLDCGTSALHQPLPVGPQLRCVPQPTAAGARFQFHVFLPVNPATRVKRAGLPPIARPALFLRVENHPEAAGLGARSDLPVRILEQRLDVDAPYVKVEVPLAGLGAGQRFAKRIRAAWVYPDITGDNFQLQALRVRLKELTVIDDGDPFLKGDGDWKFWAGLPSLSRPWTRLIDCGGCVEEKTYGPGSEVFRPLALRADGRFRGEVLLFGRQVLPIQFGGYEEDLVTSDDTGTVLGSIFRPGPSNASSKCGDQTTGSAGSLDPAASGCAKYSIAWEVETGTPVRAVLTPEGRSFASRLIVRPEDRTKIPVPLEPELYRHDVISSKKKALTDERKGEVEGWQAALAVDQLRAQLKEPEAEALAREIRQNALNQLGPNPTARHRQKVALELRELKKALPEAVYKKHLCDVETGKKCE